ncbi:MAG: MAE_28990/MAE_18760 family HEPN-like nuclease [Erysipelothrix sp.]
MKIKTKENLLDKIDEEISWRKKELVWIRSTSQLIGIEKEYALRAGIPIAYAHFEGAIKNIASFYIIFVSEKKLKYCELSDNFIALGLRAEFQKVNGTKKVSKHTMFVRDFSLLPTKESNIPTKNVIDTESNLNKKVFEEICITVGMDTSKYESKFNLLDEIILNLRNQIAHGERLKALSLDTARFLEICDTVMWFIDNFADDIFNMACDESYKKMATRM